MDTRGQAATALGLLACLLVADRLPSPAGAHAVLPRSAAGEPPPASTANLEAIFLGRCHEYVQCLPTSKDCPRPPGTLRGTCQELWQTFLGAFAYRDPCQAGYRDYEDVVAMATPIVEENKTLFWSGEYELALAAARVTGRYSILELSLLGSLANGLTWCGQSDPPGVNYNGSCPVSNLKTCPNNTVYTFWKAASRAFARQAKGVIQVVLNGSRSDAYNNTRTFATNELPNLNSTAVSHVNILLVYHISIPGNNQRSRCDEGTVQDLQNDLTDRGFSYTCVEDPEEFRLLQCASDTQNPHCNAATSPSIATATVLLSLLAFQLTTRGGD